jgi:hypothetical protein
MLSGNAIETKWATKRSIEGRHHPGAALLIARLLIDNPNADDPPEILEVAKKVAGRLNY